MNWPGRVNRYVDFTIVEVQEGGADVIHAQKHEVIPAFDAAGWTNDRAELKRWLESSEPGDMFAFQSGWIFHRIPK